MKTIVTIENEFIQGNEFIKNIISRDLTTKGIEVTKDIVEKFKNKGYTEEELELEIYFNNVRFHDTSIYSFASYRPATARVYVKGTEIMESAKIKYSYRYGSADYTKQRNEEGLKVRAIIVEEINRLDVINREIESERKRKQEAADLKRQEEIRLKDEQEKIGEEIMKLWAKEHGSELLQLRIEENMNWKDLAKTEYCQAIFKGSKLTVHATIKDTSDYWKINNADIQMLRFIKQLKADYPNATFEPYRYKIGDPDYDEVYHTDYFDTIVNTPLGEHRVYIYYGEYNTEFGYYVSSAKRLGIIL